MPHLIIEYAQNLDDSTAECLVATAHETLMSSGEFSAADVKTRAVRVPLFRVGHDSDAGFVHCMLYLIEGRSTKVRAELARAVVEGVVGSLGGRLVPGTQVTCDVRDIDVGTYAKLVVD